MAQFFPASAGTYNLNSSIGSTDTSFTLSSFLLPVSGVQITMALLNSAIGYGTIAPKTSSAELISFTGITANADGTSTLTGVTRGLNKTYPYTSSSTFKLPHSGQSIFILSDAPQVFNQYASTTNDQTFAGVNTFTQSPIVPDPLSALQVANKEYVDNIALAGAPNASTTVKGVGEVSVAPVSPTTPIFVGQNDPVLPTQAENDALVGTSGTPSSSNKFVTNDDTSSAAVSGKVVRASGTALPALDGHLLTAVNNYQVFTVSGTWSAPSGVSANSYVFVQAWGAGGAGGGVNRSGTDSFGSGGGGGAYSEAYFRLSDLGSTVTVTVGAGGTGGTSDGIQGGNTTFGTLLTAYGGGSGTGASGGSNTNGGGGGGIFAQGPSAAAAGAAPLGGTQATPGGTSTFGGGGGGQNAASSAGGHSVYGGGGGSSGYSGGQTGVGGNSLYGGAGGAGASNAVGTTSGGTGIVYGGNGGIGAGSTVSANGGNGSAPGGGGGGASRVTSNGTQTGGNGGRGEVRVWVIAGI